MRLDDRKFGIPRRATASRLAPKRIYKPRRGLDDFSVLSKSGYGRNLSRAKAVIRQMSVTVDWSTTVDPASLIWETSHARHRNCGCSEHFDRSGPPTSAAADQTITESFSLTAPPSVVPSIAFFPDTLNFMAISSTPFPLFAPTTGTLDSVGVTITGSFSWASIAENPDVKFALEVGNGLKGFDIIGEIIPVFTNVGTIDLNISGGGVVGDYVGAGSADAILSFATDNPANTGVIESNGLVTGSITYTYTPRALDLGDDAARLRGPRLCRVSSSKSGANNARRLARQVS